MIFFRQQVPCGNRSEPALRAEGEVFQRHVPRGFIDPALTMPVMLGVLVGALAGTWTLVHAGTTVLRRVFVAVVVLLGLEMIYQALTGGL